MFSSVARASLCTMRVSALRYDSPEILLQSRPSATSLIVKSNSLPATKSTALDALRLPAGFDRHFGADQARFQVGVGGFERLDRLDVGSKGRRRSVQNDKIEVARGCHDVAEFQAVRRASMSLLPSTSAAGWASQVGYQNERISRRA